MYKKNDASPKPLFALVVNASNGAPITAGVACKHYQADGTETECDNSEDHEGNGTWRYVPSQTETNETTFAVKFYHADAVGDGPLVQVITTQLDPDDTVRMGMTALPNAAADAAGGLSISDAGALDLDNNVQNQIIAYNLDHLMRTAVNNNDDMTDEVYDGTVLCNIMTRTGNTSNFVVGSDSLEGLAVGLDALNTAIGVAQSDLDTITGTGGVLISTENGSGDWNTVVPDAAGVVPTLGEIVDGVWDEPLTGSSHNDATSSGKRLRQANLGQAIANEGTAQAGGNTTITLADAAEDTVDDLYHEALCFIAEGTGAGQVRFILSYDASERLATVHVDWEVNPDTDSVYVIYGNAASNLHAIQDDVQSVTDFKDFVDAGYDPGTNKVQGVVLTDTCTTNTDLVTATEVKTAIEADGSKVDHVWETTEDDSGVRRFTTNALEQAPGGGGNVTVGDITDDALAKFCTENTGETTGASGSVAKIAQGSAGGNVTVEAFTGDAETQMDAIQIATDQIGSANITVSSPIATDGDITLHQYDDYDADETRSLEWTNSNGDWGPDDITDATVEFVIRDYNGVIKLTADGIVVTPTGTQKVRVELANDDTDVLDYATTYEYQLRLILDTTERQETIAIGKVTITTSGFDS